MTELQSINQSIDDVPMLINQPKSINQAQTRQSQSVDKPFSTLPSTTVDTASISTSDVSCAVSVETLISEFSFGLFVRGSTGPS